MAAPRKDNVKDKIISACERLINERSIADVSLADIAREAGVSKGTLYYHYNSKNDVLFDITEKYLAKQYDDLIAWTENQSKDTSLHRLVMYVLSRDVSTANMRLYLICEAISGNEELRKKLVAKYNEFAKKIAEKVAERGAPISPKFFSWLILSASDGLFIQNSLKNDELESQEFIDEMTSLTKLMNK